MYFYAYFCIILKHTYMNITKIVSDHAIWLKNSTKGKQCNLSGANLSGCDLSGTDLRGAILSGCDLRGAILRDCDLRNCNLRGAILSGCDLRGCDLTRVDLRGCDLSDCELPLFCEWQVSIKNNIITIGCKSKTIEEWDLWFAGTEEYYTARNTKEFKRIYAMYLATKAYMQAM